MINVKNAPGQLNGDKNEEPLSNNISKKPNTINFTYNNDLQQSSFDVKNIIGVQDTPSAIAVNPDSNMIYLPASDGYVYVINGKSDIIIKKIPLSRSSSLTDVQINPRDNKIYVTDYLENAVFVIDGKTNELIDKVNVEGADYMAFNPKTNLLYVTTISSHTITVLDGVTNDIIDIITLSEDKDVLNGLVKIAVNPNNNMIYAMVLNSNYIPIINASDHRMVANISVGIGPNDIAVNPNANLVYISNYDANRISIVDGETNNVTKTIVGNYTTPRPEGSSIEVDQFTNTIFLANSAADSVTLINGATNKAINTILVGNYPVDITVDPRTNKVYTANLENSVSVIINIRDKAITGASETNQSALIDGIKVKDGPIDLAINPNTNLIYVIYSSSNTIDIIDGNIDRIINSITLPSLASAVAVDPFLNSIYAAVPDIQSLITIDGETNRVINTTEVGVTIQDIAVDPDANSLYLSTDNSILTMNSMTKEISSNVTMDDYGDFAIDANLNLVYVMFPSLLIIPSPQ
jgi:YVTN family beta-propeller protein